jgi:hypothetical protein
MMTESTKKTTNSEWFECRTREWNGVIECNADGDRMIPEFEAYVTHEVLDTVILAHNEDRQTQMVFLPLFFDTSLSCIFSSHSFLEVSW